MRHFKNNECSLKVSSALKGVSLLTLLCNSCTAWSWLCARPLSRTVSFNISTASRSSSTGSPMLSIRGSPLLPLWRPSSVGAEEISLWRGCQWQTAVWAQCSGPVTWPFLYSIFHPNRIFSFFLLTLWRRFDCWSVSIFNGFECNQAATITVI